MKKLAGIIGAVVVLALFLGLSTSQAQQGGGWSCSWMGQGGPGGQGWHCPWMNQATGTGGYYTQGGWFCPYLAGWGCLGMQGSRGEALTREKAAQLLQDYLQSTNNSNLKLTEVTEKGDVFEAGIVTADKSLVDRIQVDKTTWLFRSVR